MTTKGGRAAGLDSLHDTELIRGHAGAMNLPVGVAVETDDVLHLPALGRHQEPSLGSESRGLRTARIRSVEM